MFPFELVLNLCFRWRIPSPLPNGTHLHGFLFQRILYFLHPWKIDLKNIIYESFEYDKYIKYGIYMAYSI